LTVKIDLPNLYEDEDRHGNTRRYARIREGGRSRKIRLKHAPGTPEFLVEYNSALAMLRGEAAARARPPQARAKEVFAHTLAGLAHGYFNSSEFQGKDKTSQRVRRQIIEDCLREPLKPGSKLAVGDVPYLRVDARHMLLLRDRRKDAPGAANNRLKYMSALFGWAIDRKVDKLGANPCRDVKKLQYASDGFYTWTREDVAAFIRRHSKGSMAYLALCLMLFLGARRGDAIRLGPLNMRGGAMTYVPRKTAHKRAEPSVKPVLAPLAEAIKATRTAGLRTFLVTNKGQPFSDAGFGNKMREWCDQAGLPECSSHGLKKIAATICAEAGATDRQMMALFDWSSEKMAGVYTSKANKVRLAQAGAAALATFSLDALLARDEDKSRVEAG
jgi:integrase